MGNRRDAYFSYVAFTQTVNEQVDLAVLADELGFDAMWFGEHIVLPLGGENIYMPKAEGDPTKSFGLPRSVMTSSTSSMTWRR